MNSGPCYSIPEFNFKFGVRVARPRIPFVLAAPLLAHHSVAGTYDISKSISIKGTITRLEWRSPHSFLSFDAKDANGRISQWQIELGPATALTQAGLDKDKIILTQSYALDVIPAKDGSLRGPGLTLTFENGPTYEVSDKMVQLPPVPAR